MLIAYNEFELSAQLLIHGNAVRISRQPAIPLVVPLRGNVQNARCIILRMGILCGNRSVLECGLREP
jgi:hypothetical protein